jgi:hypothetical protein
VISLFGLATRIRFDRREVGERVERQVAVERGADRLAVGVLQQRVAVGRRLGDGVGRDVAAGAGAVLHHDRLAERLAELAGDQSR